ncbi:ComEC/Rec2 family competence protein [Marinilabilia salmonicolor]|uniref:ComEC/Rec2 family competence protein n=1 Tax=Marinilabilia salmonicolor TaxID=989 RepID=UPI00029B1814|nr:ComEC/Rec2 family competence protein [Marinilabilia salmonicolor]
MKLKDLARRIPFLFFAFALGTGIWLARFVGDESYLFLRILPILVVLISFFLLFSLRFSGRYRNRWISGGCFYLMLIFTGLFMALINRPSRINNGFNVKGTARVVEADVTTSGYHNYTVKPLDLKADSLLSERSKMIWRLIVEPADSMLQPPAKPGNIVEFAVFISGHKKPSNPGAFDYGEYLFRQGISGWGFVEREDFKILRKSPLQGLIGRMSHLRLKTIEIYRRHGISGEELQVLSALTLGVRSMLDDEIKDWFIHSGAVHVLAVSGLHTGIIFLLINWLLNMFLPERSSIRVIIVIGVLIFYALLTGGAPSVFRAVVMLSVIQIGNYSQRSSNIYNLLGVSAFLILLIHPMSLFHMGFLLSHLAVAGIVTFYPVFAKLYSSRNIFIRWGGDLAAVSLSAQLGTLPLSLFTFRAFPSWFLLSNFLVLPMVAPILVLAKCLVIFSEFRFLSLMIAGILNDLLRFMLEVVEWLDSLPWSYVQGLWINESTVWILYALMVLLMLWFHTRMRLMLKGTLFLFLLLMIVLHLDYWRKSRTDRFVIFDVKRERVIGLIESGQGLVIADTTVSNRSLDFACSGFFSGNSFNLKRKVFSECWSKKGEAMICSVRESPFLVLGDVDVDQMRFSGIPRFEGVVFSGDLKGDVPGFLSQIMTERLIVAKSCPPWCIKKFRKEIEGLSMELHFVAEDGAFVYP